MKYGPLAQVVEHLTFNQVVPGSSPGWLIIILLLQRRESDAIFVLIVQPCRNDCRSRARELAHGELLLQSFL